jgi:hypothetical protein
MKPLFPNYQQPEYLWFADAPPRLGGIPRQITIAELEAKIGNGFQYLDMILQT